MRPFVSESESHPLGCSRPLERVLVDFAADQPFARARAKLLEHYGFEIGESTIQRITFAHASGDVRGSLAWIWNFPKIRGSVSRSSWKPTAGWFRSSSRAARRRTSARPRNCRGARRSFAGARAREPDAGLRGLDRGRGRRGRAATVRLRGSRGFRGESRVHAVGDGAPWIVGQIEQRSGDQGSYLIDFYHVCEYLGGGGRDDRARRRGAKKLVETQKEALKGGASRRRLAGARRPLRTLRGR